MKWLRLGAIFIFCAPSFNSFAQGDPALANEYLQQADMIYTQQKEAIMVAKDLYVMAAEADPSNIRANWMAGFLHLETTPKDHALPFFLKVKELSPSFRFDIDYFIGNAYHHGLDFENALVHYEVYRRKYMANASYRGKDKTVLSTVDRKIRECKNGLEIVSQPSRYSVKVMGSEINSEWPDYAPMINKDETLMIFTSRRLENNTSEDVDMDNFYFEDIFYSEKVNGEWTKAKNIGAPINTPFHDANISLSFDQNRLYLYKDENHGDIYFTDFINGEWSKPQPLSNRINSSIYAERSITETSDPGIVIYSSDRPGGEGGLDLYMITKDEKGNWYKTKSLGPVINTQYDEDSPFMLHDGKTLYFSSTGQKGYGGFDIFKSVYDSAKGEWGVPENLGYPVNTPDDEIFFTATRDGKKAYFASIREEGKGFTDIFMIKLHSELQPHAMLVQNTPEGGGENVEVKEEGKLYDGLSEEIFHSVENIYFELDNFSIRREFLPLMDSIINLAQQYPRIIIDISGFSSSEGNPRYNIELSNKRALAVLDFFIRNGVNENQISARGYGSSEQFPEKEKNRRADIRLIYASRSPG